MCWKFPNFDQPNFSVFDNSLFSKLSNTSNNTTMQILSPDCSVDPEIDKGTSSNIHTNPLNMDTGDGTILSTPAHTSDAPSISSPLSKAKLAGMWKFNSEYALLEMAEEFRLWIHQHGKMEVHYIIIADALCRHFGLVCLVISLCHKYNAMLDAARKQAAVDVKATGEKQLDAMQLLAAKLVALKDDSKVLSEACLFLGLFF